MPPTVATNRRPTPAAAAAPGPIAQVAADRAGIDQAEFERQARLFIAPTPTRPALLTNDEARKLDADYGTGRGKLTAMTRLIQVREARWEEMQGEQPFHQLNALERQEATGWFTLHGVELAPAPTGPRVAPPNPVKEKIDAEKAATLKGAVAQALPAAATPATPATSRPTVPGYDQDQANRAADAEIAKAESKKPGGAPAVAVPPPATLEIEFVSADGFACKLTLQAANGNQALEQGGAAMKTLVAQKAKPAPLPAVATAAAPSVGGNSDAAPECAIHHTPMEKRKGGRDGSAFWSCPKKLDDGSWCPYKPK